ncbi:MAG: 16S rRNA (cytidine(1402)-2'-O)-methyltransferase [Bacteroidales bacterium]|jgi:16S rRNA (cytidine1402-2'-O)-methyltransferase|nr:16S rRNA (cytidine(1402)-2'-O)-methyltransferase [Bacteroidales bacterium]
MKLYLVPTPIGNLGDMTFRAVEVLKSVDTILAEDTRTSRKLLQHFEINTPLESYHMYNEHGRVESLVERLMTGCTMAVITDAGTPGISDPGFLLVREALKNGVEVECLPGATAVIPALASSGLPCDRFVFEGFLPHKKGRQTAITRIAAEERTSVMYESPYRLVKLLDELTAACGGERQVAVCRELSKLHEEVFRGTLNEAHAHFSQKEVKGEIVVVLGGRQS